MEICLHLGAHRTGTTSLQRYMKLNQTALSDDGVATWGPRRTRAGLMDGLLQNPDRLSARQMKLARRAMGLMRIEQKRLRQKGYGHLVISEENLIGTMNVNLSSLRLYPQAYPRLSRAAPAFKGQKLRVGLAIRSYDAHWTSQMAFRIKAGDRLPDIEALDRIATQPRRWRHVIDDIARSLPGAEIIVWPFEGWVGQPEQMLSSLLGWPISLGKVRFAEHCNPSPDVATLREILRDGGDLEAAQSLAGLSGPFQPFPDMHRAKLQNDYREDIDWLLAGADGLATYLDPTGGTSGVFDRQTGSMSDDIEERRLAGTG